MERQAESFLLFGREAILERLTQRLEALKKGYRQNVALVGPRFMGKTHLLRRFLEKARRDPEVISIYIGLTPGDFDSFLERWLGSVLQGFLASHGIPFPEEFQQLVKISREFIPKTLERMRAVKKYAFQKKGALAFRELLALTTTLGEEAGKKIVLILDEFQCLGRLDLTDPFGLFGKEMMIQKGTLYLATSSEPHRRQEIFSDRLLLLFGNFEVIEVGPLKFEEIQAWAGEACPEINFSVGDLRLLSYLLHNHPYYFGLFFEALRRLGRSRPEPVGDRAFLLEGMTEAFFSERGALNQHFEFRIQELARLGRDPWPWVRVLVAIANGRSKLLPIAAYLGKKGPEVKKALQRLIQEGVLEKRGSFYAIPDPTFRFWLRNVFHLKEKNLEPDFERSRELFRNHLQGEVRKIEEEDQMDLSRRVENLFREFRNDQVEINGRKIQCPHFLEIASRPTNGRYFPILGRTEQARWFCQVLREPVTESDVAHFLEELRQSRRKVQRRLMVALGGIELNAKLMAQEAKIQIWDLDNFNALLDLYGKLKVIL